MIIPPAIAHGRSDGFIAAAAEESRRERRAFEEGFKIKRGHKKKEKRNSTSGDVLPALASPFRCLSTGDFPHLSRHHATAMACCCVAVNRRADD